jgi:putative hemolysin
MKHRLLEPIRLTASQKLAHVIFFLLEKRRATPVAWRAQPGSALQVDLRTVDALD